MASNKYYCQNEQSSVFFPAGERNSEWDTNECVLSQHVAFLHYLLPPSQSFSPHCTSASGCWDQSCKNVGQISKSPFDFALTTYDI